ncbi:rRNA maturation RNase YbeY [Thiohalorhabdus sp.]|uniref:rRNA maturation RNase YbeY n=1 Tax=Thiohalorhabdus sp. TaxID=3094134 RepID=UPI002FC32449
MAEIHAGTEAGNGEANPVVVQLPADASGLPSIQSITEWVRAALARVPRGAPAGEVVVRAEDADEMARLNADFRGKEAPTNVLSFPADLPPGPWEPVLGDVVLCPQVVDREAADQGKTVEAHWAHMVVHGTLHLVGYDHQETAEAEAMEGLERRILDGLGYDDPYAEE